jgi:hypothetical protein
MNRARIFSVVVAVAMMASFLVANGAAPTPASATAVAQLTRYPYLTDAGQTFTTVNWATDRSATKGALKWGAVGSGSCTSHTVSASKTQITVNGVPEYQWKAKISNLTANTQYCYRIFLGGTDLLGTNVAPQFWTLVQAGADTPYSFAVFGDWGDTDQNGDNPQQAAILQSLGQSGARFALGTGDTGYDSGTQSNYGDLNQKGFRISSVFGPGFWPQAGASVPLFNAVGNHGMNATFFNVWPQDRTVANSSGTYAMETYCCANGSNSQKSPSAWYAFTAGNARYYILTTAWGETNIGSSSEYGMDFSYRWQQTSPEYQWLKNDLQSHPTDLKFAVFHYPLYSDNATEGSDPFLRGPDSLEGLLTDNGVNMVFNGHSHMYERNHPTPDGLVSYVSGGGGARPQPISHCQPYDAYGIGWSNSTGTGSSCGTASKPTQKDQVFHYLKVDIDGSQVTVSAVNALGQTFDVQTYDFGAPDDTTDPTAPSNLVATAQSSTRIDLSWDAGGDNVGVTAYDIYRNDDTSPIGTVNGSTLNYTDNSVTGGNTYSYTVRARDAAGNASADSNVAEATTPAIDVLFSDDFESGDLSKWTSVSGLTTSNSVAGSGGSWVARETSSGTGATYAYKSISPSVTELYARFRFQVISRTSSVDLMRLRNGAGGSKFSLLVSGTGKLAARNSGGVTTTSSAVVNTGQWYTVEVHGRLGTTNTAEVWLDGTPVAGLSGIDVGSTNFGQLLLGHTAASGTYDVAFDDVTVAKQFI